MVISTICPNCGKWSPGGGFCLDCHCPLSSDSFEFPLNPLALQADPADYFSYKRGTPVRTDGWVSAAREISAREAVPIPSGMQRQVVWFLLVNAAVAASLVVLLHGRLMKLILPALLLTTVGPLILGRLARDWAVASHEVKVINPENPDGQAEADLYELVRAISQRASLEKVPDVGWYENEEVNAFSVGKSRDDALIVFSSALLNKMDPQGLAAVVAHEVAHVANGDMATLTLVQGAVDALGLLVVLPLWVLLQALKSFKLLQTVVAVMVFACKWVITYLLLLPGNLLMRAFSRRREFYADRLAAALVDGDAVLGALEALGEESDVRTVNTAPASLSAFKINAPATWWGVLFSSHPTIQQRITAVQRLGAAAFPECVEE